MLFSRIAFFFISLFQQMVNDRPERMTGKKTQKIPFPQLCPFPA
jgi:hypothetical protein